ncbi:hypothetical protein [Ferrigenium sp. UT5]|uniref:hypothetical protein n=1 Tax=Ferrigenium sp. UT5 TaxID=3242105 RepID=UPI003551D119
MSPSDHDQKATPPEGDHDGKTVILQRCPKHGTLFMPGEVCPACAKEKTSSGS